jgi:hypothetical protein
VHGDEAVSDGYRYRVECLLPDAGLELKSLLGVAVRLGIAGASACSTANPTTTSWCACCMKKDLAWRFAHLDGPPWSKGPKTAVNRQRS